MNKLPLIQITKYPTGYSNICTSCGACCRRLDKAIPEMKELLEKNGVSKSLMKFPYKHTDGVCEKLGDDGLCTIYDKRPNICNIAWVVSKLNVDRNKFYDNLIKSCNELMDETNVDEKFRIIEKND